jgi:2-isopropylmalate synthase
LKRESSGYAPPFELVDYKIIAGQRTGEEPFADASMKIRVGGQVVHTAAEGNGPVSALDAALRKALAHAYPEVNGIRLEDYKVRILDGVAGTSAIVRVLIENGYAEERWSTVGASANVIEASWLALVDGIEYGLGVAQALREGKAPPSQRTPKAAAGSR